MIARRWAAGIRRSVFGSSCLRSERSTPPRRASCPRAQSSSFGTSRHEDVPCAPVHEGAGDVRLLDPGQGRGVPRSTATSGHSVSPSAAAPSSEPKQSRSPAQSTSRRRSAAGRSRRARAAPRADRCGRSSRSPRRARSRARRSARPARSRHRGWPRSSDRRRRAHRSRPAARARASSAWVAWTTVVRGPRQPVSASSSIGRSPCSARHSSISRGCSSACTCSGRPLVGRVAADLLEPLARAGADGVGGEADGGPPGEPLDLVEVLGDGRLAEAVEPAARVGGVQHTNSMPASSAASAAASASSKPR